MALVAAILALISICLPQTPLWKSLAYDEHSNDTVVVFTKRASWLPGPPTICPEQLCGACAQGKHTRCLSDSHVVYQVSSPGGVFTTTQTGQYQERETTESVIRVH